MAVRPGGVRVDVQFTEQPAERLVLVEGQFLVAEEPHLMIHQGVMHFLELLVAQWLAEIDAEDLGADDRRHRPDLNRFVWHADASLDWLAIRRPGHPPRSRSARRRAAWTVSAIHR